MANNDTDQQQIRQLLNLYALAVDTIGNNPAPPGNEDPAQDDAVAQLEACLAPDSEVLLYFEGPDGPATPAGDGGPESFGRFVRSYFTDYGYVGTYHLVGNVVIDFADDDHATVRSYINSTHWLADDRMLLAPILYVDTVERTHLGWRIRRREIQVQRFWITDGYSPDPTDPTLARPTAGA